MHDRKGINLTGARPPITNHTLLFPLFIHLFHSHPHIHVYTYYINPVSPHPPLPDDVPLSLPPALSFLLSWD